MLSTPLRRNRTQDAGFFSLVFLDALLIGLIVAITLLAALAAWSTQLRQAATAAEAARLVADGHTESAIHPLRYAISTLEVADEIRRQLG